jgi:Uma2 family endonuclease
MKYGVREYWIVNPEKRKILVYVKGEEDIDVESYTFGDKIKAAIFEDLEIDFKEFNL